MDKYIKRGKLKENTLMVATEDSARRKKGDLLFVCYVQGGLVGYDFNKSDFSECPYSRFVKETRGATKEELSLYLKGKRNINE